MEKQLSKKAQKGRKGSRSLYDIRFRKEVARSYLEGKRSMLAVAERFGLPRYLVKDWVKYYKDELAPEQVITASMTEEEQKELEGLKRQIESLKKKLNYEQMKNFALETMADLAKEELGIDIRKNFGAKQPGE